ncbi:MAG: IS3 family transposase [Acidobacteriota bacterium]
MMQSQGVLTIEQMCQAGGVSRAGFYRDWEQKAPDQAAMALRDAIQRASLEHPRYGGVKVAEVLRRAGWVVSVTRVQRVRRDDNLLAVRRRKFVVTTDSDHEFLVYPNLAQYMVLGAVNQLWVADITYLRLASEFVYFAVVLDAFSRRALGWAVGPSLQATLPLAALNRAIAARAPTPGLVHHSDRGTQYACNDYVRRLEECQITISMSRPARPWENARCERFMRTLKEEEIDCREFATLAELERNLEDFIERFYNRVRLHAALGYCSPEEFEQQQQSSRPASPSVTGAMAALSFRRHQEIYPDVIHNRRIGRRRN